MTAKDRLAVAYRNADALRAHADALEARQKAGVDAPVDRPKQTDCRYEPAFPAHETVVFAMSAPNLCIHLASRRCSIEEPHLISNCLEFRWMTDKAFEKWWAEDGRMYDPDTEDVPWFDKRKELAELAFAKGLEVGTANSQSPSKPKEDAPVEGMLSREEREAIRKAFSERRQNDFYYDAWTLLNSHDICERALRDSRNLLREAEARGDEWKRVANEREGALRDVQAEAESLNGQLDNAESALKTLYVELSKLSKVAQAPISTVGRMLRIEARRNSEREALAQQPPQAGGEQA